jgi:hypothetical protein
MPSTAAITARVPVGSRLDESQQVGVELLGMGHIKGVRRILIDLPIRDRVRVGFDDLALCL